MRKNYFAMALLLAGVSLLAISCSSDKYDDTEIWGKVNDLDRRVSNIETQLSQMNKDIVSLQQLIQSKQGGGVSITGVNQTSDGTRITFSDGKEIFVKNGQDGVTPTIGSDGYWYIGTTKLEVKAVGNDGVSPHIGTNNNWWIGNTDTGIPATSATGSGPSVTVNVPIIGVQVENGVYYWTQTINGVTTWITDKQGNKLRVTGESASRPLLQVNVSGYWVISYDGGKTWEVINDAYGKPVSASVGGECKCESFFQSVTYNNGVLILVLIDGTTVRIQTEFEKDDRFDTVVPHELQLKVEKYMPLYTGVNPPNVEGCYLIEPQVAVYHEDYGNGGYEPGHVFLPVSIRFSNQDTMHNTLDYAQSEGGQGSNAVGTGAYISGNGNNFTAYFLTEGSEEGIYTKTAIIVSGTKTTDGIKDLYYAYIMEDKGYDPVPKLMNIGAFRVNKDLDGLSINTTWAGSRRIMPWRVPSCMRNFDQ